MNLRQDIEPYTLEIKQILDNEDQQTEWEEETVNLNVKMIELNEEVVKMSPCNYDLKVIPHDESNSLLFIDILI